MIARIMGEGQFDVDPDAVDELNRLDGALEAAITTGDEGTFRTALHALLDEIGRVGTPLEADSLEPSDLILPPRDATMDEVREMLGEEGLIPG